MTLEAQRIAVAQLHGLTNLGRTNGVGPIWADATFPFPGSWLTERADADRPARYHGIVPDYLNDLNAVAAVEAALPDGLHAQWEETVYDLLAAQLPLQPFEGLLLPLGYIRPLSASAAIRVKALLMVRGRWVETP